MSNADYNTAKDLGGGSVLNMKEFKLGSVLGKGAFGSVYKATHIPTGTVVAVKQLLVEEMDDENLELFAREIAILAKCRKPFLLHLIGYSAQKPFSIVTPFIPQGSLHDYVHHSGKKERLPPTNKTLVAMGMAYAMMRLHEMDIIHRDLKPANVLLNNKFLPYICDFGIARPVSVGEDELMTRGCGTPVFMPLEQFSSQVYTKKVDVYSYGMILYEMLTGKHPYEGSDLGKFVLMLSNGQPPAFPRGDQEDQIKGLIMLCINPNPSERPSFKTIYKAFSDGKVMFDDTNPKGIKAFLQLVDEEERYLEELYHEPSARSVSKSTSHSHEKGSDSRSRSHSTSHKSHDTPESSKHSKSKKDSKRSKK